MTYLVGWRFGLTKFRIVSYGPLPCTDVLALAMVGIGAIVLFFIVSDGGVIWLCALGGSYI